MTVHCGMLVEMIEQLGYHKQRAYQNNKPQIIQQCTANEQISEITFTR